MPPYNDRKGYKINKWYTEKYPGRRPEGAGLVLWSAKRENAVNGHNFVSLGCAQFRCNNCGLTVFLDGANNQGPCEPKNKAQRGNQ